MFCRNRFKSRVCLSKLRAVELGFLPWFLFLGETTSSVVLISYLPPIKIRQQIKAKTRAVRPFVSLLCIHVDLSVPAPLQEEILTLSQDEEIQRLFNVNPSTCVLDLLSSCIAWPCSINYFFFLYLQMLSLQ